MITYPILVAMVSAAFLCGCGAKPEQKALEQWGPAVKGLRLRAWTDREIFATNEPIMVKSAISNASRATIIFWESGFWPNTKVDAFDERMRHAPMTQEGIAMRQVFSPGGARDKNAPMRLKPGDTCGFTTIELRSLFQLERGRVYFVQITYEERQSEYWQGRLESNMVRIQTAAQ